MDLSEVKLVVSDMDGTLLNTNGDVSDLFFNQFYELKKLEIHFVAASGRQYPSIANKLKSIEKDITIIAENGGVLHHKNNAQTLLKLDDDAILKSINILRTVEDCYIVLCGKSKAYIETNNLEFINRFERYYTDYTIVDDLTKVENDDFLKIAVFHFESSETHILPFIEALNQDLKIAVSAKNWLDISHKDANKGYALQLLQKELGISMKETLAFGDYNNDLQMLEQAYYSFAMENAHPNVKQIAKFETKSNNDQGVEFILQQLINSKKL